MNRLPRRWREIKKNRRKGLVCFMTAGDPSLGATARLIPVLERAGVDLVELGVPFSDPMADGPVIQKASERALARGVTLKKILNLVASVRKKGTQSPLLLMGYYNPILAYGLKEFARDAARAGVDAALVVDLPPEESGDLDRELKRVGLDLIYLLTPTSDAERIRLVTRRARGFIYFVSITGITGGRLRGEAEIRKKIAEIRRQTKLPIAIGFGIRTPADARRLSRLADGVVVGSALVQLIRETRPPSRLPVKVENFIHKMKQLF